MVQFSDNIENWQETGGKKREAAIPDNNKENSRIDSPDIMVTEGSAGPSNPVSGNNTNWKKVEGYYTKLLERAVDIRARVEKEEDIAHSQALAILHLIIDEHLIDEFYEYAMSTPGGDELTSHSIAVAAGSLKMGMGLGYDTKKLLRLGLAAFLENVGMYRIPQGILQKTGELSRDERAEVRKHPEASAQILRRMGDAFEWLAEVAFQVHERSDGSGYPKGLGRKEITEAASIIGLIDNYMAMIKNRPYREKFIQTDAIKSILEIGRGKFPSRVVKEFLNQISLFPVNTFVKLNNDSLGRVLSTDKTQPMRPVIEILYDGLGQKMEEPKRINLADTPLLHIVDTIDERDLD